MSFELSIKQNSEGLRSEKITERKKCAEALKTFLNGECAPSLLSENTLKKSGFTWNDLFDDVNEFLLKESKKIGTSTFDNVKALCTSLLFSVVAGANKGKAYIKCEKLIDACLLVLRSNSLSRGFGDTCMNLLYKYIMPCDHYMCHISPQSWEDLLDVCISIYHSLHCNIDEFINLRLILLVMHNSVTHCQFVTQLRDKVLKFMKSNLYSTQDKKVQETILDIAVLLLETLSTECHQTMCEFTEYLIPQVVRFYDGKTDKKKRTLFKCFEMAIRIHHPEGKLKNETGFMAHNWIAWESCLKNILEIISTEETYLQKITKEPKFRLQNDDMFKNTHESFVQVAALIYYQICNNALNSFETCPEESVAKRPCLQYNKCMIFSDLIEKLRHDCVPWLSIIAVYLKKYGKTISTTDNFTLLNILECLLMTNITTLNLEDFQSTVMIILENLNPQTDTNKYLYPEVESLWKSFIRCSTSINKAHGSIHTLLRAMLNLELIHSKTHLSMLLRLYKEKAMPVTDHSIHTFNTLLKKNCGKFNECDERLTCLYWITQNEIPSVDAHLMTEFHLRLLSKDKLHLSRNSDRTARNTLYRIIFESMDEFILFSDFELDIADKCVSNESQIHFSHFELHNELLVAVNEFIEKQLILLIHELKTTNKNLLDCLKFIDFVSSWNHSLLIYKIINEQQIKRSQNWAFLKEAICLFYKSLVKTLKQDTTVSQRVDLLISLQHILKSEYPDFICKEFSYHINDDFIRIVYEIFKETKAEEQTEIIDIEQQENELYSLKSACINLLAIYCTKNEIYRSDILEFILDWKTYNFTYMWDVNIALNCIELLAKAEVDNIPLESIFALLQHMCKMLFRNPNATSRMLNIIFGFLEYIGTHASDHLRENCVRMLNGYLRMCESCHYPPRVAASLYQCLAKVEELKQRNPLNWNCNYVDTILQATKNNVHAIRLYCCYLLKSLLHNCSENNLQSYTSHLDNIFLIPSNEEIIVKDELRNRATSVFHFLSALAIGKKTLINAMLVRILEIHVTKSRNDHLVNRVLSKLLKTVAEKHPDEFLNKNLIYLLKYWFSKNHKAVDLPSYLYGFKNYEEFVQKHMCVLIPAEVLWCKEGNLEASSVYLFCYTDLCMSQESIIEVCFPNFVAFCLPHVVSQKYGLSYTNNNHAIKIFQLLPRLLGTDKWNSIMVESIPDIVSLVTSLLYDVHDIKKKIDVGIPQSNLDCYYPKDVFEAIFKYLEEMIGLNVIQYLSESPCKAISKIVFNLWSNILNEHIYEFKVLLLHRFILLLDNIPNTTSAFTFIYYYTCNCLTNLIRKTNDAKLIKVLSNVMLFVLKKLLPENLEVIQEIIPQLMSVLVFKAEDGYGAECLNLSNYVIVDMNYCLRESLDLVDGINALSQGAEASQCTISTNQRSFKDNFRAYLCKSKCWSYETLCNLKEFLKLHRTDVLKLFNGLNLIKGFSEDCETSLVHQIINYLIDIVKESNDEKSKIEAVNCLAEINTYDLKTLVMRVPHGTKIITGANPIQYFVLNVVQNLADIVIDENPTIADKSLQALMSVLKYKEGKIALETASINSNTLQPFLSTIKSNNNVKFKINDKKLNDCLNSIKLWNPSEIQNNDSIFYEHWLIELTITLLESFTSDDNFVGALMPVCRYKPMLCEKLLPSLISLTIYGASGSHVRVLSDRINRYFQNFYEDICKGDSQYSNDVIGTPKIIIHQHKLIVQTMLEVVDFVRLQKPHYKKWCSDLVETYNYLRLDYKSVAWAAAVSDKSMVAIFYGELWCAAQNQGVPPASPQLTAELNDGENIQSIFRKCFVSIGEMDAIDGCGTGHLTDVDERRRHLMRWGQYGDALLDQDIALSIEDTGNIYELHHGVATSLNKCGLHRLAAEYVKTLPDNEDLDDIKYQCFIDLGDWSLFVDTSDLEKMSKATNANLDSILKAFQYSCLKDTLTVQSTRDFESRLDLPLRKAKLAISQLVNKLNMDNCQSIYNVVSKLHLFAEIEDYFSVKCHKLPMTELICKWQTENLPPFQDFKHIESIILQRSLILEHAAKAHTDFLKEIVDLQLKFAELTTFNGRWQVSDRLVAVAKKMLICGEVSLVESQTYWAKGHKDIALSLIRRVISSDFVTPKLQAAALRQYGSWMAESKYESARDIIDKYLMRSLEALGPNGHTETRLKVYLDIAMFADSEYKQVVSYMKSFVFENKIRCLKSMKGVATTLKNSQLSMSTDERKAMVTNVRLSTIDEAEIVSTYEEKKRFLDLAIKYYLLTLSQGEENDLSVFRVISLWFENQTFQLNDVQDGDFGELLAAVPSRKYLPVLPQLSPRLTTKRDDFTNNLRDIITKCAVDHPHHTLPILFGLKNSHKDNVILNASARSSKESGVTCPTDEPRVLAARQLVEHLEVTAGSLTTIISQMNRMCDALISFANYVTKEKEPKQNIPKAETITRLTNLDEVPVPTTNLPVQKNCIYTNYASVVSFSNTFELVGGINCPKKMTCRGSDGKLRTILVKGQDDLRQDAVMQQVFTIVNNLLEKDPITSKKKLLIRTYKVVPLSRRSGVLEWCEGTIPIGTYLVGTSREPGAHTRYRRMDMSCSAARAKMVSYQGKTNAEKLSIFLSILKDFKPVFNYFFTEHYLEPVTWYERRLAYTKSVATSSMVGYIMGLGDRHVQNILVDKKTAEVIHIDFGIAFDQGKALPTPETIPFRLTQDMIAGFGPSGVEGVFRRCCEKTLQLLHDNQETLLTILEVLLCDPLYSWTITPAQAKRKQYSETTFPAVNVQSNMETSEEVGGAGLAQRALLAVGDKLAGEGGAVRGVAVRGQVARLLHQAVDPANLSRLFPGWQPYL